MIKATISHLLTIAPSEAVQQSSVRSGVVLFGALLLLLLVVFVACVLCLQVARRRRRAKLRTTSDGLPDAWSEAGRRATPFDRG